MRVLSLDDAKTFHGHLGPFLAIGYAAGRLAVELLNPTSEHDLRAVLYLPLKRPYTCIADGVQCSSKCTLGKLNIELRESQGGVVIVFENVRTGEALKLRVRGEVIEEALKNPSEETARSMASRAPGELFVVEILPARKGL